MKKISQVLIYSVLNNTHYVVTCLRDCRNALDQNAYEQAIRTKDTVYLKEVWAQPLFD